MFCFVFILSIILSINLKMLIHFPWFIIMTRLFLRNESSTEDFLSHVLYCDYLSSFTYLVYSSPPSFNFWSAIYYNSCCCGSSVTRSCPTLCNPIDCSPPGSSTHGIFQARILEWVATSFSRGSSWPRDQAHISCIGRQILYHWATWEAHELKYWKKISLFTATMQEHKNRFKSI